MNGSRTRSSRERVQPDQLLGQLDREGGRVADPTGALGRDRPDVERQRHEVLGHDRALVGQALGGPLPDRAGPVEAALAGHDHPFGDVAQHRVGGAAERAPRARAAGPLALLPDQLAPQQQAEVVLEDADHVGRQAPVRLAAEVGDVDRDPPARLELADALGEHLGEHLRGTRGTRTGRPRARAPPRTACRRSTAAT